MDMKTSGTAENPGHQETIFCDSHIKVVINCWKVYVYHTDLLLLKMLVSFTSTFLGHSRSHWTSHMRFSIDG